jgi:hypothetical protein
VRRGDLLVSTSELPRLTKHCFWFQFFFLWGRGLYPYWFHYSQFHSSLIIQHSNYFCLLPFYFVLYPLSFILYPWIF